MRELEFTLEYEKGTGPMADLFGDVPELSATSLAGCVDRSRMWVVERYVGPSSALDQVELIRSDEKGQREETTETTCKAERHPTVLERSPTTLVVHLFVDRLHTCDSLYALASRRLDPGVVIQSRRRNYTHDFRLLTRSNENIELFFEGFQEHLKDGISAQFGHLGSADGWAFDSLAAVSIPEEQRSTLRIAAKNGYYETPRQITLDELADCMDLPRSTVSYRLRRAEAALTKGYLGRLTAPTAD